MGVVLNWTSVYTPVLGSSIDSFPTVADGVHDVLASHVNSLATSLVAVETLQQSLAATVSGLDSSRIEDGDGDTFVDTDLAGGDSDIVTITATNGVTVNASVIRGVASTVTLRGSQNLNIHSGNSVQAADDTNGSNIQIVANDGGLENISNGGSGGGVYLYAGVGGAGALAGQGGPIALSAGAGGSGSAPAGGGTVDIFSGNAGTDTTGSSVNNGGGITIRAGSGSDSEFMACGTGGSVLITAGQGGYGGATDFVGNGGNITIEGGAAGTNDAGRTGNGGGVTISGASASFEGNGGSIQISAGNAGGSVGVDGPGTAGDVTIQGGTGAPAAVISAGTAGGAVSVIGGTGGAGAGSAPPGFGGVVNIRGGDAGTVLSAGAPDGGSVNIQGGFGEGFSGLGGTVSIDGGAANGGAGNYGNVQIGALETTENVTVLAQTTTTVTTPTLLITDSGSSTEVTIEGTQQITMPAGAAAGGLVIVGDATSTQNGLTVLAGAGGSGGIVLDTSADVTVGLRVTESFNPNEVELTVFGLQGGPSVGAGNAFEIGTVNGATATSAREVILRGGAGGAGTGVAAGGDGASVAITAGAGGSDGGAGAGTPGDITFNARSSGAIPFNAAGATTLTGFTATSIVGALNELKLPPVVLETGIARTLTTDVSGTTIGCQNAGTITITVPSRAAGTEITLVQTDAGQVVLSASGVTFVFDDATWATPPASAAYGCAMVLRWLSTTVVLVVGELAPI